MKKWTGALSCLAAGFLLGATTIQAGAVASPRVKVLSVEEQARLGMFSRALEIIERFYVRPIADDEMIHAAIDGMASNLDPRSTFMSPDQAKLFQQDLDGRFGGVGLTVSWRRDEAFEPMIFLEVLDVVPEGPAASMGMKAGDRIVEIQGEAISNYPRMEKAIKTMRGKVDTPVSLTYVRGSEDPVTVEIIRGIVEPSPVEVKYLGDKIGYIRLRSFQENSYAAVRDGMGDLRQLAQGPLEGFVLDLRNNPGGFLREATSIVDLFVKKGIIVTTRARDGVISRQTKAHRLGTNSKIPIVVLINKGSASASEIVAGALQDHKRALIVGERSYGKGSVQDMFELEDGSLLKLTTALFYTPNDRVIQASGIQPDVLVGLNKVDVEDSLPTLTPEREVPGHLRPEAFPVHATNSVSSAEPNESTERKALDSALEDAQLRAGIQHLLAYKTMSPSK